MTDARDLTQAAYRAARAQIINAPSAGIAMNRVAVDLAAARRRHPDLAAVADARAKEAHVELIRALTHADEALASAEAESGQPIASPMLRQRANDHLRLAEQAHDAALVAVEFSHATINGDAR